MFFSVHRGSLLIISTHKNAAFFSFCPKKPQYHSKEQYYSKMINKKCIPFFLFFYILIYKDCSGLSIPIFRIQLTLRISNSKGLSEILQDIHPSTYQICRIEEKLIRLTTFNKYMCNWNYRDILKIL